jgi:hypothetical protein
MILSFLLCPFSKSDWARRTSEIGNDMQEMEQNHDLSYSIGNRSTCDSPQEYSFVVLHGHVLLAKNLAFGKKFNRARQSLVNIGVRLLEASYPIQSLHPFDVTRFGLVYTEEDTDVTKWTFCMRTNVLV